MLHISQVNNTVTLCKLPLIYHLAVTLCKWPLIYHFAVIWGNPPVAEGNDVLQTTDIVHVTHRQRVRTCLLGGKCVLSEECVMYYGTQAILGCAHLDREGWVICLCKTERIALYTICMSLYIICTTSTALIFELHLIEHIHKSFHWLGRYYCVFYWFLLSLYSS